MKIIYTPRDNPKGVEEFEADLEDLWVGEVKLLEKSLQETFQEIGRMLERGSATHLLALVWIYRRRRNTDLELNDMDELMRLSELEIRADDEVPESGEGVSLAPKDGTDQPAVVAGTSNAA